MLDIDLMPDEPQINGTQLTQLLAVYLDDCARRVSAATLPGYARHLSYFVEWWEVAGPDYDWICSPSALAEYDDHLVEYITKRGHPLSDQGRFDALRRLRQALHWAYLTQRTPVDVGNWLNLPEKPTKQRNPLPIWALAKLLDACDLIHNPDRSRAIIAFLAGTGCRRGECAGLLVDNIRMDADHSGSAWIVGGKVTKRGDSSRWVAFDHVTGGHLVRWLDSTGWPAGKTVFDLSGQQVYKTVVHAAEAAGLDHMLQGPHDLRRLFVTHWNTVQSGDGYAILLQRQVGHNDIRMTERYDLRGIDQIRRSFASPMLAVPHNSGQ